MLLEMRGEWAAVATDIHESKRARVRALNANAKDAAAACCSQAAPDVPQRSPAKKLFIRPVQDSNTHRMHVHAHGDTYKGSHMFGLHAPQRRESTAAAALRKPTR